MEYLHFGVYRLGAISATPRRFLILLSNFDSKLLDADYVFKDDHLLMTTAQTPINLTNEWFIQMKYVNQLC